MIQLIPAYLGAVMKGIYVTAQMLNASDETVTTAMENGRLGLTGANAFRHVLNR